MNVIEVKKILSALKSERSNWEVLWQDIGDYIYTRKATVLTKRAQGEDRQFFLFDNTGPQSLELLGGILHGILTNVDSQWCEYTSGDPEIDALEHVRTYLQARATELHHILNNSNFNMEVHEMYMDICGFGTAVLSIEEDEEDEVRFMTKFIGEVYIKENARGKVNEIYLEYEWNARQIVSEYGDKNLPEAVKKAFEKNEEKKFIVVNAIYPNDYKSGKPDAKGHSYASLHCLPELKHEIKKEGYRDFPMVVPRFSKASGETYGRSPAMVALPEVKVLNKMVEVTLIGAEKVVDPPLQAPDDGFISQLNTFPGGISYYRAGGNDYIRPVFNDAKVDFGFQMITEKQNKIKDSFYINQMTLQPGGANRTAYETAQIIEQAMRFMGPFLGRMQNEFLKPTIGRVTEILFRRGIFKEADIPAELKGKKINVKYSSFIAKSQRMGEAQNIMRFLQAIEPFVNADPATRHYLNGEGGIKTLAGIYGVSQKILNSDETVAALNKAESDANAEAIAQERQAGAAESVGKMAQAIQKTNLSGPVTG